MSKAWNESESKFAKDVLEFVNRETFGSVAWFEKKDNGTWETFAQTASWGGISFTADTEEKLAVKYWNFYFQCVEASAKKYSTLWHRIFSRDMRAKSQERLARWVKWRSERQMYFDNQP